MENEKNKKIALEISKINLTLPSVPMPVPCTFVRAHVLCPCPCPCSWNSGDRIGGKFIIFFWKMLALVLYVQGRGEKSDSLITLDLRKG